MFLPQSFLIILKLTTLLLNQVGMCINFDFPDVGSIDCESTQILLYTHAILRLDRSNSFKILLIATLAARVDQVRFFVLCTQQFQKKIRKSIRYTRLFIGHRKPLFIQYPNAI